MNPLEPCSDIDRRRHDAVAARVRSSIDRAGNGSQYDSVVVVGEAGVSRACLVARLAAHPQFEGRITIAGRRAPETRRLTDGVSIRGLGVDVMSYATGIGHSELARRFTGTDPDSATGVVAAHRQVAMRMVVDDDHVRIGRAHRWQGGETFARPIVYGARNSRTVAQLEAAWPAHVQLSDERPETLDEARSLAAGHHPLVVNTSRNAALLGNSTRPVVWAIVAAQVPLRPRDNGLSPHARPGTTLAPLIYRNGAVDVGYVTPFADPLSPAASWYAILARPVRLATVDRDREPALLAGELSRVVDALGFDEIDPDETAFAGLAPGSGWSPPRTGDAAAGTLEFKSLVGSGLPAYYADGITTGSLGAAVAADAIAAGIDPYDACRRALAPFRRYNKMLRIEMTVGSRLVSTLMNPAGGAALWYPHGRSVSMWASHA